MCILRLEEFHKIKENTRQYIKKVTHLLKQEGDVYKKQVQVLQQMEIKLDTDAFNVLVVGEFSSGKSTLINGILGEAVLPTHVSPTTAVINIIQYGKMKAARVVFRDAKKKSVPITDLVNYITSLSSESDSRAKNIDYVELFYPSIFCHNGVRLVDTPGLNSMHDAHERATIQYLPQGSAGIMTISALQFMSKSQRDYLECFRSYMGKMFFLISMVDQMDEDDDFKENEEYFRNTLAEVLQKPVKDIKLYPINARAAEQGDMESSGLKTFLKDFEAFLTADQLAYEMLSVPVQKATEYITQYQVQKQLEFQAVSVPYDEFKRRRQEALPKRRNIDQERVNVCNILNRESQTSKFRILQHMEQGYQEMVQDIVAYVETYDGDIKCRLEKDLQLFFKQRSVEFSKDMDKYIQREYKSLLTTINLASLQLKNMLNEYQTKLGIVGSIETTVDENIMMSGLGAFIGSIGILGAVAAVMTVALGPIGMIVTSLAGFRAIEFIGEMLVNIGRKKTLKEMSKNVKQELLSHEEECKRKLAETLENKNCDLVKKMDDSYRETLMVIDRSLEQIDREKQEAERTATVLRQQLQNDMYEAQVINEKLKCIMRNFV